MKRSYYSNEIKEFLKDNEIHILGQLSLNHNYAIEDLQKNAWLQQIKILKLALKDFHYGKLYFEFSIPRMGKRVDNIILINDFIFVLEFKIGDNKYQKNAIDQVVDYCLDLKNFHVGSHNKKIIPILISTQAESIDNIITIKNKLADPLKANQQDLSKIISKVLSQSSNLKINSAEWENSIYKPTPTIIEAAQALYRGHNVKDISRNDAGAINLSTTTDCLNSIIEISKAKRKKSICFLTGVPGAGKTLAGLNIANERMRADIDEHAVFLSGNGPLVEVLREALTRDEVVTSRKNGKPLTKKAAAIKSNAFIQNIHHFRDDNLMTTIAPVERVVVFDEAQRAWSKTQASSFMKRKKGITFNMSEPEYLISVMDRHDDWCTIICLIGGGQEINTGEAGVFEWLSSLNANYDDWNIHYSSLILTDNNYLSDEYLRTWLRDVGIEHKELHLSVSLRSFRSEKISDLMHHILEANFIKAKTILYEIKRDFPVLITRNLQTAKQWLRKKAKGTERIGLVASSGGKRLRPIGIDVKNEISSAYWFLNSSEDIRSSYFLEDVATEFDIQGLEIDWVCLAWDINFYYLNGAWNFQYFSGTKWQKINNEHDKNYLKNAYRVLLTRARQGLIIFVPEGNDLDHTRPKLFYDETFNFFQLCGIPTI